MRKLTIIVSLLVFCVGISFSGIKSVRQFNAEVPNTYLQIDSDNNITIKNKLDVGGVLEVGSNDNQLTNSNGLINGAKIQGNTVGSDEIENKVEFDTVESYNVISNVIIKADSATLTSNDVGNMIVSTKTANAQFDLPYSTNCTNGAVIGIKQTGGTNTITITDQGSDTIDYGNDNTDINADNDSLIFRNDPSEQNWIIEAGRIH